MVNELERWQIIDQNYVARLKEENLPEIDSRVYFSINNQDLVRLFSEQLYTRHIDLQSRVLKQKNLSYYTIASAGHEFNVAIAYIARESDIALLHYRSSAFMLERASKISDLEFLHQIKTQIRSLIASKHEPVSNGRHKVFGSIRLNVPPQTSTIASHLPKALGLALSINQNKILKHNSANSFGICLEHDSVVLCSFGDASFNHSTAQGAFNAARKLCFEHIPLPLVFICEDNNIGISVKTPENWIASNFPDDNLYYIQANGLDLIDVLAKSQQAITYARTNKKPVFLHIKTFRLMGHAGSDIEQHYLSLAEIVSNENKDPLLYTASLLIKNKILTSKEILDLYEHIRRKVQQVTDEVINEPKLQNTYDVMKSIEPDKAKLKAPRVPSTKNYLQAFDKIMANWRHPRNMCQSINLVLAEILLQYNNSVIFGEDVGRKGGVYRVTSNLQKYFGRKRVFDTILDEQTILGTAIGYGQNGLLPIVEIQFLAYLYNAIDQVRGEAATLSFFSAGKLANPMIIRIASLAYQKGFGGHFHNDNAFAILREIPGIIIACPSNAASAVKILRTLAKLCYIERKVCVILEPIALYFTKNIYNETDNLMLTQYPELKETIKYGEISINNEFNLEQFQSTTIVVVISYANGYYLSLQAAHLISKQYNIDIRLVDLNWLHPLPMTSLGVYLSEISKENKGSQYKILIVDECRKTGSVSEELHTNLYEFFDNNNISEFFSLSRITAKDSFIPLGPAADFVLPSVDEIKNKILSMVHTEITNVGGN